MKRNTEIIRQTIYQDLRKKIINNELKPGLHIVETQIAEHYNVNKAHVHTVLIELTSENLISYSPMKGFFVIGISKKHLKEIAKIREILETTIFEDFLQNAKDEDIDSVILLTKRKIAFLKAELREEAFKETNATFEKIYSCTSYDLIVTMLKEYREYIHLMITKAFEKEDDISKTIQNSLLLIEVLKERDFEKAKEWINIRYINAIKKIELSSYVAE